MNSENQAETPASGPRQPPSRVGKQAITVYVPELAVKHLKLLAVMEGDSLQGLVEGVLLDFLGKQRIPELPADEKAD